MIEFGLIRRIFQLTEIINRYIEIYDIIGRNPDEYKATIKNWLKPTLLS